MQHLNLTLPTAEENLALDEALLDAAEAGDGPEEIVRLWEAPEPMVIAGRSSRLSQEVRLDACRQQGLGVWRRSSGGATILAGPGCLMYAVVLSYEKRPELRPLDRAHGFVLGLLANAIAAQLPGVARAGISDLVIAGRDDHVAGKCTGDTTALKFSGNSLRCKRTHMLYHGTLLYDFPIALVGNYLLSPPRQPDYRAAREHSQFIANLPLNRAALCRAVLEAFDAHEPTDNWPRQLVADLVVNRYTRREWTEQFV